jgi:hypothetical protein
MRSNLLRTIAAGLLAFGLAAPSVAQLSGGGAQSDIQENRTLDLSAADSTSVMPIGNGQGVVAVDITGLTGSGATVVVERTVGGVWSPRNLLVTGSAGAFTNSISQDGSFTVNTVGSRSIRFRVSVAGTGTARIYATATQNSSVIQFGTSLPAGALTIGKTILPDGASTSALQQSMISALGSPLQQGGSVGITGTVPISAASPLAITGTFWQATQPVSGTVNAAQSGAWSIANTAFGISGTLPAFTTPPTVNIGTMPSVAVSNFPASQAISGTVAATQSGAWNVGITGTPTVTVGNASIPVTGTFFQATQPVSGTVNVGNLPATQQVAGTVAVSNFPAVEQVADNGGSLTIDTPQLPASVGAKTGALSLSVAPNTDMPFPIFDRGTAALATAQVAVGTTATLIAPARAGRRVIVLIPTSNTTYYVGNAGVTTTTGVVLGAGAVVTMPTSAAIYAVATGSMTISYMEFF